MSEGSSSPLGATPSDTGGGELQRLLPQRQRGGVAFFEGVDRVRPSKVIRIDPSSNCTYHYWHVFVPGVRAGQIYGYRVEGPYDPASGMRFTRVGA